MSEENTGYLYRHVRLDTNEVFYVGISLDNRKNKFIRAYNSYKRNQFWKNIVAKTDYEVEIMLMNLPRSILIEKEKEFIKLYGRKNLNEGTLVNLTDGGDGTHRAKFPNRKMAEKQRLSMIGRKLSQETKDKISAAHKGRKQTPEAIESRRIGIINSDKKCIPIVQKDKEGNIIKVWRSGNDARLAGFPHVTCCCRGNRLHCGGYRWEYYDP
jgi:hypothetical protein